ncbi:hypothetical protein [Streptomyces sodiiphilus]|uniref:hypothetical protein n=1 Tax=Streptomyces sodiiphilus TaxID=226217 RepID=UPI0031CF070C
MNRGRRSVAAIAAVMVIGEALALGLLHWVLGLLVDYQQMSLAGLPSSTMSLSAWAGGGLVAGFLLLCAAVLARSAVRDRPPGRWARVALTGAAVLHAVLAALAVGLAGWAVFTVLITVFALLMLVLAVHPQARPDNDGAADPDGPPAAAVAPGPTPA